MWEEIQGVAEQVDLTLGADDEIPPARRIHVRTIWIGRDELGGGAGCGMLLTPCVRPKKLLVLLECFGDGEAVTRMGDSTALPPGCCLRVNTGHPGRGLNRHALPSHGCHKSLVAHVTLPDVLRESLSVLNVPGTRLQGQ